MTGTCDQLQGWLRELSGGVLRIAVVSPFNMSEMMLAAAAGNQVASQAIRQVERAVKRLHGFTRPNKKAPLCLFCPTILWRRHKPEAVIIISRFWHEAGQFACHFVCHNCCSRFADGAALNDALLEYYRRNAASGLRLLPPFLPAGRA
jgi:hypothetical protein